MYKVLVVNPGSTSTKLAIFEDETCVLRLDVQHTDLDDIRHDLNAQLPFRVKHIQQFLSESGYCIEDFDMISCRCGGIVPAPAKIYRVNQLMRDVQTYASSRKHASQLGGPISWELTKGTQIPIVSAYPPNVEERDPIAKISGLPEIPFPSGGHVLNVRTVSRKVAKEMDLPFDEARFVVVHLGGGITVSAVRDGRIVDVLRSYQGPMSAERSGNLPSEELIRLCYSGKYTEEELMDRINLFGGLYAYTGSRDTREIVGRAQAGDQLCTELLDALCYQTAKSIGTFVAALRCKVHAIILTGSMARSEYLTERIEGYVQPMAQVKVVPGELEMEGLAEAALRVLRGEESACEFDLIPPPYHNKEEFYTFVRSQQSERVSM